MDASANLTSKEAEQQGCLVLLRHGETEWSKTGQYTGRTDLPLTANGRQQAVEAGRRLLEEFPGGFDEDCMFVSPLDRAQQTAHLAGFDHVQTWDALAEWDYGRAEGRRPQDVADLVGWDWQLWTDGPQAVDECLGGVRQAPVGADGSIAVRDSGGESLAAVGQRALEVVQEVQPLVMAGQRVLLVAHAHVLRIVTAQWLGLGPQRAQLFAWARPDMGC